MCVCMWHIHRFMSTPYLLSSILVAVCKVDLLSLNANFPFTLILYCKMNLQVNSKQTLTPHTLTLTGERRKKSLMPTVPSSTQSAAPQECVGIGIDKC